MAGTTGTVGKGRVRRGAQGPGTGRLRDLEAICFRCPRALHPSPRNPLPIPPQMLRRPPGQRLRRQRRVVRATGAHH
jgi:hypothetical protein